MLSSMSAQPSWQDTQPAWYDESTAPRLGRDEGDEYDDTYLDDQDDDDDQLD